MSKMFFPRMAAQNIRKNARTYVPYLITCICAVSMFYVVCALAWDPAGGEIASMFMRMGVLVIGIFALFFLFYTNSFLMKRRKKEFGLMSVLGLERRHIARIVALETLYVYLASMVAGLGLGVLFSKAAHYLFMNLLEFNVRYSLPLSTRALGTAFALFSAIFLLLLISALWQVVRARPVELIRGGQVGEREPRARWLLAALGLVTLGAGYAIAVTTKEPVAVIMLFFLAVVLVIIGTYLLFTAGSVALLKLLRRNKDYYYQPNHFISLSGMLYRMKQNAAGLATICILSTMVLVMISSTAALYFGMEDSLKNRYPREVALYTIGLEDSDPAAIDEAVFGTLEAQGLTAQSKVAYRSISLFGRREGGTLVVDGMYSNELDIIDLTVLPLSDYTAQTGAAVTLAEGEALIIGDSPYGNDSLTLLGQTYRLREDNASGFYPLSTSRAYNADTTPHYTLVLPELSDLLALEAACAAQESGPAGYLSYQCAFDFGPGVDSDAQQAAIEAIYAAMPEEGVRFWYSDIRQENRQSFLALYGGLFFLGLLLGFVFLLATVLIIYYKQVSEGYDDRQRYDIMQKVGLSRREARRAINSQILTMFFLPLLMAFVHVAFAFPAVTRMLFLLNLDNVWVFLAATGLAALIFTAFYMAVYRMTAGVYYRLVDAGSSR